MKKLSKFSIAFSALILSVNLWADHAVLSVSSETECQDLLAGQTIDAGEVCFSILDNETLQVSYNTENGWQLFETHLWVGDTIDGFPMTKKGNPKIGNFPYQTEHAPALTTFTYTIPLSDITSIDLEDLDSQCGLGDSLYSMAHAVVGLPDGEGGIEFETAWAAGDRVVDRGSWATRSALVLEVNCEGLPPQIPGQETAIMYGDLEFRAGINGYCGGNPISNRWGWQHGLLVESADPYVQPIYAAAGGNDINVGTHVGDVSITVSEVGVTIDVVFFAGFEAEETHIYIGAEPVCSASFGKDWTSGESVVINTNNGVYVGVHFSVLGACQNNGNFCSAI